MTKRSERENRAIGLLDWADSENGRTVMAASPQTAQMVMVGAQVHATLALAEQQRIANVLRMAESIAVDVFAGLDELGLSPEQLREMKAVMGL